MNGLKDCRGRFSKSAIYVARTCVVCHREFKIKESALKYGRGIYCSRKCCDEHKKEICVGEGNGRFGKKESEEHKKIRIEKVKRGTTAESVLQRKKAIDKFVKINGYWPGTDKESCQKRTQTCLKKYGVSHNWMVKEVRKKCNETCIKKYGKSMWQLMIEALKLHQTEIETITKNILDENSIQYQLQFQLWDDGNIRIYDCYIPSANLLIELDGDFWHGNPQRYSTNNLMEVQRANILNDKFKNDIAKKYGYNLVRFWESDIKQKNYSSRLLESIKQYENVTIKKKDKS